MAHQDVFEESKLTIGTQVSGEQKADKAQLVIVKDDADQPPKDLTVEKSRVETEHTFDKVADDKDNYALKYKIKYGTETIGSSNDYTVWPKSCKVKLVDKDGNAVKKAPFDLSFENNEKQSFETGDDGSVECELKHKAKFRVTGRDTTCVDPGENAAKDKGRSREIKVVQKTYKISKPDHDSKGAEIKQYVNLATGEPEATAGHDKKGRVVVIVVEEKVGKGVQNDVVHVRLTITNRTKRTSDAPELKGVEDLDATDPLKPKGKVKLGADKKGTFKVDLGVGGGETVLLEVGSTTEYKDDAVKFVNARKLFYQHSKPGSGAATSVADATAALQKAKIEIERYAMKSLTKDDGSIPAGSFVDLGNGEKFVLGTHNESILDAVFTDTKTPIGFHLIFCDLQYDGAGPKPARAPLTDTAVYDAEKGDKVTWPPSGKEVKGFSCTPLDANAGTILKVAIQNGKFPIKATWKRGIASGTIPKDHIHIGAGNKITIQYPSGLKTALFLSKEKNKGSVTLEFFYATGPYNGWSIGKHTVIALTNPSPRDVPGMNKTVVHEVGHMLKQAGSSAIAGLDVGADHGRTYTGRGHSGGHCAHGIDAGVFNGGGSMKGRNDSQCVMYGEGAATRPIDYCPKCMQFVLAEPLSAL